MYFINFTVEIGALPPHRRSGTDVGYDLYAHSDGLLLPQQSLFISVGVRMEMPRSVFAFLTNTSSWGVEKVICLSHIIDSGYRGDLGPILFNLGDEERYIYKGDKVAQIVFMQNIGTNLTKTDTLVPGNREDKHFD